MSQISRNSRWRIQYGWRFLELADWNNGKLRSIGFWVDNHEFAVRLTRFKIQNGGYNMADIFTKK